MSNILRPVGPQPTRVYWVRRTVLLVVALLAFAAVIGVVNKFTSGAADATEGGNEAQNTEQAAAAKKDEGGNKKGDGEKSGDAEEAESTEAAKGDGTPEECTAADVQLSLGIDRAAFGPDQAPEFSYELTNAGTKPCLIDVNDVTRTVVITSGNDQVFSSGFCVKEEPRLLLLKEKEADAGKLTWDRSRNDEKCSEGLPAAKPGTYRATVQIQGSVSDEVVFTLS